MQWQNQKVQWQNLVLTLVDVKPVLKPGRAPPPGFVRAMSTLFAIAPAAMLYDFDNEDLQSLTVAIENAEEGLLVRIIWPERMANTSTVAFLRGECTCTHACTNETHACARTISLPLTPSPCSL